MFALFPLLRLAVVGLSLAVLAVSTASYGGDLHRFLDRAEPSELLPGADRLSALNGGADLGGAYRGEELVGYVFLNSDWAGSVGYSGKPIHILVGMALDGRLTGTKLVDHKEPIVLIGIPEKKITDFMDNYIGENVATFAASETADDLPVDIVSGATVTIMVIDDSIRRAAIKVARAMDVAGLGRKNTQAVKYEINRDIRKSVNWETLVGDGSVRRLLLANEDVNKAFQDIGDPRALKHPIKNDPKGVFIDVYAAVASVPTIGRSLLGEAEYQNLKDRLEPGQQALLFAGNGDYSFKGSGYVRGGVFDRIQVIQGDDSIRFRDRHHKRIGDIEAEGAPDFKEIALFIVPENVAFDPTRPWHLQLLVQRAVGALDKVFTTFNLDYQTPNHLMSRVSEPEPVVAVGQMDEAGGRSSEAVRSDEEAQQALWMRVWKSRIFDIAVLVAAILFLTVLFFFQDWFVRRPKLTDRIRIGFLLFTVIWIGYYANAQLSVVNVLTVANAFGSGFDWGYFLMDPLVFILWFAVAAALIFWGRGAYCGWLCPFGALQELLNKAAKFFKVPQIKVPFAVHQRLWPIKYVAFLALFGISFHALDQAERLAEVEPFKTAIILSFMREWPFIVYAVALLIAGLFIERFYCRYLCPLGAALAIPARLRVNDWLKRYKECGSPCQRCANDCMVQAIHPNGQIDPNECLYCLNCQQLYYDDQRCPVMIQKRLKREKRKALASDIPISPSHGKGKPAQAGSPCKGKCS